MFSRTILAAAAILFSAIISSAWAYNVPGSSSLLLAPTTRAMSGAVINSLRNCAEQASRQNNSRDMNIAFGAEHQYLGANSGSMKWNYRQSLASACLSSRPVGTSIGTLRFGASIQAEFGDGTTGFNRGSLSHSGAGIALFVLLSPNANIDFFAAGGIASLSYDATRNGGLVRSSFDAIRSFLAAGVTGKFESGKMFMHLTGSGHFVNMQIGGYTESGTGAGAAAPGFVRSQSLNFMLLSAELKLGVKYGNFRPYLLFAAGHDITQNKALALPTGGLINLADASRTTGAIGIGIEGTFGQGATLGIETRYVKGNNNFHNWVAKGKIVIPY